MPKKIIGLTLIELLVSMGIMSMVILGMFGINIFSQHHVISSGRRAKVQNEISYAIEFISKYVQQANGNLNRPAIQYNGTAGFRVYLDLNASQTPSNLADDGWIDFTLSTNTLNASCTANGGSCPFTSENLNDKIIAGFAGGTIMPDPPTQGCYVNITDQGTAVDIGLVGRYDPAAAVSASNPQVSLKTRLVSSGSSAN